ncbi:hypothetical protein ACK3Y1_09935 [Aeromonas caviae]
MSETKNLISNVPSRFFNSIENQPWHIINTCSPLNFQPCIYKSTYQQWKHNTLPEFHVLPVLSSSRVLPVNIADGVKLEDEANLGKFNTVVNTYEHDDVGTFFVSKVNETTHKSGLLIRNFLKAYNPASTEKTTYPTSKDVDIDLKAEHIFSQLKEERYVSGELSIVDYRIESLLLEHGEGYILKLMNKLAVMCYSSKLEMAYAHYLNVLKNLTYHSNDDILKTNVLAALSHRSAVIKEAAIAIFEGWRYSSGDEMKQMIGLLENIDADHVDWLNEYKLMVIRDLKEELEAN